MFTSADFVRRCLEARRAPSPADVVADVVRDAITDRSGIERALGTRVGPDLGFLHVSDELVVQRMIFPVGYSTGLHEHRLWTVSGVYAGVEQHDLHRVVGDHLEPIRLDDTRPGEVRVLAPHVAHDMRSTGSEPLGVFHVYLGNLFETGAGEWDTPASPRRDFSDAWFERLVDSLTAADLLDD